MEMASENKYINGLPENHNLSTSDKNWIQNCPCLKHWQDGQHEVGMS